MAFVVAEGRLKDLHRAPSPAFATSLRLDDGRSREYAEIWRSQPQVRTVVDFLARNIAQLGLHTYRRISDTDRERLTDHPLARLIARPTPDMTTYRLVQRLVSDLAIYDVAFLVKMRARGEVGALVPVPPDRVMPIGDNWLAAEGYRVRGSRGHTDVPAEAVAAFRGYNPSDLRAGVSPMETLRSILIEEHAANKHRIQMWRNGARASGYLKRPTDAPEWSDTARQRFKTDWQAQYTGDGPQAGGTPILEDGMSFERASFDPAQAQYIEARKLTREEVAAAYHVPPPLVGILDHATYSNIQEQHKQLYQDTLGPWLVMIAAEFGLQVVPDVPDSERVYVEFPIEAKLRGSFEEQAAAASTSTGRPWMTVNEQRAKWNLPQVDGGDDLVVPLNVLVGGQASPRDSAPDEADKSARPRRGFKARPEQADIDHVRQVMENFFTRQHRALTGKAGTRRRRKTVGFEREHWDAELAAELYALAPSLTEAAARKAMAELGLDPDDYDADRTLAWLLAHAEGVAAGINEVTQAGVADANAAADSDASLTELFATYAGSRAAQIAVTETTALTGFGSVEAVRQSGRDGTKTWQTTSKNSRRSHARLNGQTVKVGELFGNRARWPGDSTLPAHERANCSCFLQMGLD